MHIPDGLGSLGLIEPFVGMTALPPVEIQHSQIGVCLQS
jgi:hypothetical protein